MTHSSFSNSHAFYYIINLLEPDFSFTNLKMMSESSKRHSKLLSLIFILNNLIYASKPTKLQREVFNQSQSQPGFWDDKTTLYWCLKSRPKYLRRVWESWYHVPTGNEYSIKLTERETVRRFGAFVTGEVKNDSWPPKAATALFASLGERIENESKRVQFPAAEMPLQLLTYGYVIKVNWQSPATAGKFLAIWHRNTKIRMRSDERD